MMLELNGLPVKTVPLSRAAPPGSAGDSEPIDLAIDRLRQVGLERDAIGTPTFSEEAIDEILDELRDNRDEFTYELQDSLITITDKHGQRRSIGVLEPPRVSDREVLKRLEQVAESDQELLKSGGTFIHADGVSLRVPGTQSPQMARDLLLAAEMSGITQELYLDAVLGSRELARSLVAGGVFGDRMLDHVMALHASSAIEPEQKAPPPPTITSACADHNASPGHHKRSRTPSQHKAYVFSPITVEPGMTCATPALSEAVKLHDYSVIEYDGKAATFTALKNASGKAGILYICAHGSMRFDPSPYAWVAALKGDAYASSTGDSGFHASVTSRGYHYVAVPSSVFATLPWKDRNTIAIYEGCVTSLYVQRFGAREALGYQGTCPGISPAPWRDFWARLSGVKDAGTKRNVGDAYQATFVPSSGAAPAVVLTSREEGKTVLSPGVSSCAPDHPLSIGKTETFKITFDAPLQKRFANRIPQVSGCNARVTNARFVDDYTLTFDVTPRAVGPLAIAARSQWALSKDWWSIRLDGNRKPGGTSHVGPNGDDFTWQLTCN
ncbi:MAG: hypothetical protein QNJ19_14090 [Woeseiaceae bacterium]|nr:hypothetical protein [Woeseiaceae bacterium]